MVAVLRCSNEEIRRVVKNGLEKVAVEVMGSIYKSDVAVKIRIYKPSMLIMEINDERDLQSARFAKKLSSNLFIIGIPTNEETINGVLETEEIDDIYLPKDEKFFKFRAKNWVDIASKRVSAASADMCRGKNAFKTPVWSRSVKFKIRNEHDIALFWEYFINDKRFDASGALSSVRVCCLVFESLLERLERLSVVYEENDMHHFVTIRELPQNVKYKNEKLDMLIAAHDTNIGYEFKKEAGTLSIFTPKAAAFELRFAAQDQIEQPKRAAAISYEAKTTYVHDDRIFRLLKLGGGGEIFSAKSFVASNDVNDEDIESLADIESQIGRFLESSVNKLEKLNKLGELFLKYSAAIEKFIEFNDLTVGVGELADILINLNAKTNEETLDKLLFYVSNIKEDLASWRVRVFVFQDANNVHYLDASLISSIVAAKSQIDPNSKEIVQSSELELF